MMNRFLTIPMRLFACTFVLVFLTHCGFLKERSNETRAFLDKPDSFDQVKLKSSTPAKDTPEKSTQENTSAKAFEEKHQATEKLGAVLVFSSKQKPEFQYFTKFLTEKKEIDPLVGPNNEKLNLTDLENMDENLPLPSGSDLGSYIFHRDAKLRGVENKLYTLPTDKLSEFGVDEQAWESAWNKIKSNCSSDMQAALVRSEFDFDVNDVSFQDFIVDEDYIVRKDDKLIFTNLAGIVQRKLLEAFKPNLQQVQGTLDGQFAFCNSDTPQIWRYDGNHFVPSIEVQNTGTNPRSIFETTVTRQFLDRIALQDNQKLSDLKLGDDYSLFSREKYRHHEELQIPNMNDVFVAIQKAGTERPKKVETSNSESSEAVTATEAEVQSPSPEADHNEIQKWILAQPKRQTKPLEDSEIEVRKETLQEHQPVVVSRGNSQMYDELKGQLGSQVLVTKDGHLTNNPFYSIIPKRLSSIFYDGPDNYLSDDSGHVVFKEVNGVTPNGKPQKETLRYTPFSRMWNDDGFKNGPTFNDAFVYNEACKGYPLVRDTTFSASLVKPKEFSQRTYLTIDGHSKSFKEVVGDQIGIEARDNNDEIKDILTNVLFEGAYYQRRNDPVKQNQRWHLRFCLDPVNGKYDIYWKSSETELAWNPNEKWDIRYAEDADYIRDALAGNTSSKKLQKNPILISNPKPWHKTSNSFALKRGEELQTVATLVQESGNQALQNIFNKLTQSSPTQVRVVCSDAVQNCYVVFQATIQRAIPSEIVSFYVTPPSVWGGSQKILLIDGYDLVYKKMIKSMIEGFESEGRIRKNTITMYGAIALNDLTTPVKSETLLPLHALQDNKIMIPSDVEMHHSGTVQFNGETNDFFVGLEFTPIEADEALAQK